MQNKAEAFYCIWLKRFAAQLNLENPKKGITLDIEQIEKLVDIMKDSNLSSMEIEEETFRIRLAREKEIVTVHSGGGGPAPMHASAPAQPAVAGGSAAVEPEEKGICFVKSPMVGTFYRAPSPDSPPFAEEGGKIKTESVVCIIEAMKVMNEIQSEVSGKIIEILVENGEPVEYGQALMKVKEA